KNNSQKKICSSHITTTISIASGFEIGDHKSYSSWRAYGPGAVQSPVQVGALELSRTSFCHVGPAQVGGSAHAEGIKAKNDRRCRGDEHCHVVLNANEMIFDRVRNIALSSTWPQSCGRTRPSLCCSSGIRTGSMGCNHMHMMGSAPFPQAQRLLDHPIILLELAQENSHFLVLHPPAGIYFVLAVPLLQEYT
ncbi:unnamed protein product, partial [Nesidiocoris tenuis]